MAGSSANTSAKRRISTDQAPSIWTCSKPVSHSSKDYLNNLIGRETNVACSSIMLMPNLETAPPGPTTTCGEDALFGFVKSSNEVESAGVKLAGFIVESEVHLVLLLIPCEAAF